MDFPFYAYHKGCTHFFFLVYEAVITIQMENGLAEKKFHWVSSFFFTATSVQITHFTHVEVAVQVFPQCPLSTVVRR